MAAKTIQRAAVLYALACLLAIGMSTGILCVIYTEPLERTAVFWSAGYAFVVQLIAFSFARTLADKGNAIAGWGIGAVICFTALIVYGFTTRSLGLPQSAALLSLATFFFLTELIEPPLLTV